MITSEEVKIIINNQKMMRKKVILDYISQQEKRDELLELYRELKEINEVIILMLMFPPSYKKEFERLGGGDKKQELLKQIYELESESNA
jgi:hypothetical protein